MKIEFSKRTVGIAALGIVTIFAVLYFGGIFGQVFTNYSEWLNGGGLTGDEQIKPINWNPIVAVPYAFTVNGLKSILLIFIVAGIIFGLYTLYDRFDGKDKDSRGFTKSKSGAYGTADFMTEKRPSIFRKAHKPIQKLCLLSK